MKDLETTTAFVVRLLQLVGATLALVLLTSILIGIARSTWRVARSQDTLILPFHGGTAAQTLHRTLAEQLTTAERYIRRMLKNQFKRPDDSVVAVPIQSLDIGPLGSPVAEFVATIDLPEDDQFIVDDNANIALDAIQVAGIAFSPNALLTAAYQLRSRLAKRTVRGSYIETSDVSRIVVTINDATLRPGAESRSGDVSAKKRRRTGYVFDPLTGPTPALLSLVEDAAFRIVKARIGLLSGTNVWKAYTAFCTAYESHMAYLESGDPSDREAAVDHYRSSVAADPSYPRASYNLASLLYDRYTLEANMEAIALFRTASRSNDVEIRAMAHAGVAFACCQNVDRFDLDFHEWVPQAAMATNRATRLRDIAETRMASGWLLQITKRYEEAVAAYLSVAEVDDGREPANTLIKSFALNNAGWILMARLDDLAEAETLLQRARELRPNKNIYAVSGEISRRRGDFEAAVEFYEHALALDPHYVNGLNELGMVYVAAASRCRDDQAASRAYHSHALDLHRAALSLVSDSRQRASVEERFVSFRRLQGWSDEAIQ